MAITAIPSLFPNATAATETNANATAVQPIQANANAAALQQLQAPAIVAQDTVRLTAERVYQLYSQGQPVSLIAEALNLTIDQVNSYLNIPNVA